MRSKVMAARKPVRKPMPAPMMGKPAPVRRLRRMPAPPVMRRPAPMPKPAPRMGAPAPPRAVMSKPMKPIVPKMTTAAPPKKVVKAIAKADNAKDGFNKNKTVESDDDDDFVTGEFSLPPPPMRPVKKLAVKPVMGGKSAIKPVAPVMKPVMKPAGNK